MTDETETDNMDAGDVDDELDLIEIDEDADDLLADLEKDDLDDADGDDEGPSAKATNYGARVGQTIAGRLVRGSGGRFASSGASATSGRGNAALVRADRQQTYQGMRESTAARRAKGKGKGGEHAENRAKVFSKVGLAEDATSALAALAAGDQPAGGNDGGLEKLGLATRDAEGALRLTSQGRALFAAANRGNAGRARDALSLGKDRAAAAVERERKKAEKEKQKGKGGGGGGKKKPTKEEQRTQNRQKITDQMTAQDIGLNRHGMETILTFADGGNVARPELLEALANEVGLLVQDREGGYRLNTQGRRFVRAVNKGDMRGVLDALSEARDRLIEEQEAMDDEGQAIEETKADRYGGIPRSELRDSDFVDSERRSFPIMTRGDVRNAVSSWGRYKGKLTFEQFKKRLIAIANRKGLTDALPKEWKEEMEGKAFIREGEDVHPSAMIAFLLGSETRTAIIAAAGLSDDDAIADHVTLLYLSPEAANLDAQKNMLVHCLADLAGMTPPVTGAVNGYGRFVGDGEEGDPLYVNIDCPSLPSLRERLAESAQFCGISYVNDHGFTPHTTLTYLDPEAETPDLDIPKLPLTFDRLALVWAGETMTFPLMGQKLLDTDIAGDSLSPYALAPVTEVKAIGEYRLWVRGVVYGGRDLVGDAFTRETDIGAGRSFVGMPVYYDHAQRGIKSQIGNVVAYQHHDDGIDFEVELDRHKRYVRDVLRLEREKALGGSTGALPHLVIRENGTLKRWIIGELSLTPTACEVRTHKDMVPSRKGSVQPEATREAGLEMAGDAATTGETWRGGFPIITTTTRRIKVEPNELKSMLEELFKTHATGIESKMDALSQSVDTRLKAFEDAPALKNSGWVSHDGGSADKQIKSFADWLLAVKRRDTKRLQTVYKSAWTTFDSYEQAVKDLNESSGPAGGYLVPTEYEPMINRISAEAAIVEPRARQIKMNTASKMVPMLKQTANPSTAQGGSAFFGGLVFYWNPEGADISTDKSEPSFEMIELIARKLTGLTISSNELIEDASSIESDLVQLFGEGLAHAKDFFYLRGDGVGKPLGVLNAPARYQLTRTAAGNNVEMPDVSGMMARMIPGSFANAIWVSHPLNISDIIQLKIGDTPVFQSDAKGSVAGTLLGRPLAFSEYVPAPGAAGDLMLCDFRAYGVGMRNGIAIASSEHARFDLDQTTWRITYRGDGQPLLDSTVKLADGANTEVSPFVVLN